VDFGFLGDYRDEVHYTTATVRRIHLQGRQVSTGSPHWAEGEADVYLNYNLVGHVLLFGDDINRAKYYPGDDEYHSTARTQSSTSRAHRRRGDRPDGRSCG